MRVEGAGTQRLQQPKPARPAASVQDLKSRMQAARAKAMADAKAAEAHVRRLGSARLAGMEKMPWESASNRIKGAQENLERTSKAIKAGKLIYNGLSQSARFVAVAQKVTSSGAAKGLSSAARKVVDATDKVTGGKAAKVIEKAGSVAEYGKAYVKGELVEHVAGNVTKAVTGKFEKKAVTGVANVGGKAAAKAGAKVAGKAAARFVPGANVAMAAYDVYKAGKTLADPKASGWKKGTAVATAAFSVVAATNIPVVSQVAAGLSVVSDLAGKTSPKKIAEGARDLGKKAWGAISSL